MNTLTVSLVLDSNGIDSEASKDAFCAALAMHIEEQQTENANFLTALNTVFDNHPNVGINLPILRDLALRELNVQLENHKSLSARIEDFVRANSQGKKLADGTYERPDSTFVMVKGRTNAGTWRRADMKA